MSISRRDHKCLWNLLYIILSNWLLFSLWATKCVIGVWKYLLSWKFMNHVNDTSRGCLSRMSLAWRMKSNLKSSGWLIHFINPNRGIGPIFDNFEDNWVGIILTWDETFYMHETRRKYIFMAFLTSDFAIFCCSWNRDTISWREVSRTIPPIIISFKMKWTLNC